MADVSQFQNFNLLKPDFNLLKNNHHLNNSLETEKILQSIRFEEKLAKLDLENLISNYDQNKDASFLTDDTEIRLLKSSQQFNNKAKKRLRNNLEKLDSSSASSSNTTLNEIKEMKQSEKESERSDHLKTSRLLNLYELPKDDELENTIDNIEEESTNHNRNGSSSSSINISSNSDCGSGRDTKSLKISNESFLETMKEKLNNMLPSSMSSMQTNDQKAHYKFLGADLMTSEAFNEKQMSKYTSMISNNNTNKKVSFLDDQSGTTVTNNSGKFANNSTRSNVYNTPALAQTIVENVYDNNTKDINGSKGKKKDINNKKYRVSEESKTDANLQDSNNHKNLILSRIDQEREQLEYEKLQVRYDLKILKKDQEKLKTQQAQLLDEIKQMRMERRKLDQEITSFEQSKQDFEEQRMKFQLEKLNYEKSKMLYEQADVMNQSKPQKQNSFYTTAASITFDDTNNDNYSIYENNNSSTNNTGSKAIDSNNNNPAPLLQNKNSSKLENLELMLSIKNLNMKITNLNNELEGHKTYIKTLEECLNNVYKENVLYKHKKRQVQQRNELLVYVNSFLLYAIKDIFVDYLIRRMQLELELGLGKLNNTSYRVKGKKIHFEHSDYQSQDEDQDEDRDQTLSEYGNIGNDDDNAYSNEISRIFTHASSHPTKQQYPNTNPARNSSSMRTKDVNNNNKSNSSVVHLLRQHNLASDLSNIFTKDCSFRGLRSGKRKFKIVALLVVAAIRMKRLYAKKEKKSMKVSVLLEKNLV